jgi:hypothetical protein
MRCTVTQLNASLAPTVHVLQWTAPRDGRLKVSATSWSTGSAPQVTARPNPGWSPSPSVPDSWERGLPSRAVGSEHTGRRVITEVGRSYGCPGAGFGPHRLSLGRRVASFLGSQMHQLGRVGPKW